MLGGAGLDGRHFLDAQILGDRYGQELRIPQAALNAGADLIARELENVDREIDRGVQVLRLFPIEMQRVGRLVVDEDRALPVEDVAAGRVDADGPDSVVLREREVIVVPDDLHVPVAKRQRGKDDADSQARLFDSLRKLTAILADPQHRSLPGVIDPVIEACEAAGSATTGARGRRARPPASFPSPRWLRPARAIPERGERPAPAPERRRA